MFVGNVRDGVEHAPAAAGASCRTLATNFGGALMAVPSLVIDETGPGRAFTIGKNVPPDVDLLDTPGKLECEA